MLLGVWAAVRRERVGGDDPPMFRYECEAMWTDDKRKVVFSVTHPYQAGATALAATVLQRAADDRQALSIGTPPPDPNGAHQ